MGGQHLWIFEGRTVPKSRSKNAVDMKGACQISRFNKLSTCVEALRIIQPAFIYTCEASIVEPILILCAPGRR